MTDHRKPVRLATTALHHALAGEWEPAQAAVVRISDECGGEGLHLAMIAWCDAYIDHATDGATSAISSPRTAHVDAQTGKLERDDSPTLRPDRQWVGRLLAARGRMDHDEWDRVVADLPDDGTEIGRYFMTLLHGIAGSINGFPRGYATVGRGAA